MRGAYPISCPCHVIFMWKWPHHVVTGVQTHLILHNICLWTIFQRKVFSHMVTCVILYTLYLLRCPFPLLVKCTWRYIMAQDHWFSSTRRKLVHFNHMLPLMMRKCINKSFRLATIGFWLWIGKCGNQHPQVGNQIYLFMHFLIVSCNEQFFFSVVIMGLEQSKWN